MQNIYIPIRLYSKGLKCILNIMLILPKIGKCYKSGIKRHKIWKEKKLLLHCNTPSVILTEISSLNTVMEYNVNLGGVFFF